MIVVKELISHPNERLGILSSAYFLKLGIALFTSILFIILVLVVGLPSETSFYIFIVSFGVIFQSLGVIEFDLQSKERFKEISLVKIAQTFLSAIIRLILIYLKCPLSYFVIAIAFDYAILALIYAISQKSTFKTLLSAHKDINTDIIYGLIRDSWPILLSALSIVLYTKMDQFMLAHLMGLYEVGVYSSAVKVIEASYFFPIIFASVCLPILVRARQRSFEIYKEKIENIFTIMIYSGFFVGLLVYCFADFIVPVLFGGEYNDAVKPLKILSAATVFVYVGSLTTSALVANNLQRVIFYRTLASAVVNVILNLVLISRFGIVGAAYATLVTMFLAAFLFDGVLNRTRYLMHLKIRAVVPRISIIRSIFH